jgi:hypothetical protein
MSKTLHFIITATAEQLAKVWPDAPRYTNVHTDPWHFVRIRVTNSTWVKAWESICDDLGADSSDVLWDTIQYKSGNVGDYSIELVPEDEADDMIREAEAYLSPLDLTDDES